jgi:hypothetical protein
MCFAVSFIVTHLKKIILNAYKQYLSLGPSKFFLVVGELEHPHNKKKIMILGKFI